MTARLKIYFGVAPKARGVAGDEIVEGELDLDALLARKPRRVVVEDLAHVNAKGSKHVVRWQDVLELLDAGIEVHASLDVRELASLRDVVHQITGVEVGETVPDHVFDRADEIELVDVSPDKTDGNLLALRELALRRTAERVEGDVIAYRKAHGIAKSWPTTERILVCVGPSPGSERLIRATKRIAEGMHATWAVAHVEVLGAPPLPQRDRERVENHLRLAESLGATIERLAGTGVADALLEHARATNVTRIVAGKPTHARWRDRLRGSLLDDLIRGSGPIEVHVIAPVEDAKPPRPEPRAPRGWLPYASAVGAVAVTTVVNLIVFPYLGIADITMLYLIAIMLASLGGRGPAIVAASLAVALFDFCFAPPRWTLAVTDARHILTFVVMFGAGLAISTLTARLRGQQRDAVIRERNTAALLAFTRDIAASSSSADIAATTVRHLETSFPVGAAISGTDLVALAGIMPLAEQELAVARWAIEHRQPAGLGTDTLPAAHVLAIPLVADEVVLGVLVVQAREDPRRRGGMARPVFEAFARQAGLALGAVRARTEELRSSLLSAVSHDLRTPLAVITGAATSLRDDGDRLTAEAREELVSSIVDDAQRLERVLANLLQLTRVESGLVPQREPIPVEELVGAALTRLEDAIGDRTVELAIPSDLLVSVDPVLFEQVLINLLDNALKHGKPPIELRARRDGDHVVLEVRDHGTGVPANTKVFDKFVRASSAPGAGLGLAVVRAIVEAHGGTVDVANADDGGARFTMSLGMAA